MTASQIEFEPQGRGFISVAFPEAIHYPMQGQLVGRPPVDEENARLLNEAAAPLNEMLRKLGS